MGRNTSNTNTFVLEYRGDSESTEAAFDHLISTITDRSPEITGFRLELSTADSFDGPLEIQGSQETAQEAVEEADNSGNDGESNTARSDGDTASVPSLRDDALPAQVLSLLCNSDGDKVRSSDLQSEFDDEEVDTARISQTLASLKRRELVAAEPDPEDNRANIYWPTEKGQQALEQ